MEITMLSEVMKEKLRSLESRNTKEASAPKEVEQEPLTEEDKAVIEKFANLSLEDALEVIKPVVKEASFKEAISAEEDVETEE